MAKLSPATIDQYIDILYRDAMTTLTVESLAQFKEPRNATPSSGKPNQMKVKPIPFAKPILPKQSKLSKQVQSYQAAEKVASGDRVRPITRQMTRAATISTPAQQTYTVRLPKSDKKRLEDVNVHRRLQFWENLKVEKEQPFKN